LFDAKFGLSTTTVSPTTLTIHNVEKIRPGKSTLSEVKYIFGTPDHELFSDGKVVFPEPGKYKIWQYDRDAFTKAATGKLTSIRVPRLTFTFEKNTAPEHVVSPKDEHSKAEHATQYKVIGANWNIYEDDPEKKFEVLKSQFRSAHFKRSEEEQLCSHLLPEEVYFDDEKIGLSITWLKTKKKVDSISWSVPGQSRSVADATSKAEAKKHCRIW